MGEDNKTVSNDLDLKESRLVLSTSKSFITGISLLKILTVLLFVTLPIVGFYFGYIYCQGLPKDKAVSDSVQKVIDFQPTNIPEERMDTYVNQTCGFSFEYPHYLAERVNVKFNEDGFSATGAEFEVFFELNVYRTNLDPVTWWNNESKSIFRYANIYNIAFNDTAMGKNPEVPGKHVIGQSRTPGGSIQSESLLIIPRRGCLIVIEDNTRGYYYKIYPGIENIRDTFKFSK